MSVVAVRRRLFLGVIIGVFLAAPLAAWAETEADQIARAQRSMDAKDYDEAIKVLTPLTSSPEPTARDAKKTLAQCYRSTKQWDKAIPLFESVLRDYHMDGTSVSFLQSHLGMCLMSSGEFGKMVAALKEGPGSTPPPPGTNRARGERLWCCYVATDDWGNGVPFFNSLVEKWPQDAAEWHLLSARCNRRMGFRAEAIASLEKALELSKGDLENVKRIEPELVGAYNDSGQTEKAQALIKKLCDEYPGYDEYMRKRRAGVQDGEARRCANRGYRLQDGGECEKAIEVFKDLIQRYPECKKQVESAHVCIVECLQSLGRAAEAKAYAKKLYDEQPDMRAGALFAQGILSLFSKDYNSSVVAFRRVINEYPKNMHAGLARSYLVSALQKGGWTDEAVRVLGEIAAEETESEKKARSLLWIGTVYQEGKRYRDAIKAFTELRAVKGLPVETIAEATYRSGVCYHAIKYYSSARMCMDQLVRLYPDGEWAKRARGALYVWANYGERAEVR